MFTTRTSSFVCWKHLLKLRVVLYSWMDGKTQLDMYYKIGMLYAGVAGIGFVLLGWTYMEMVATYTGAHTTQCIHLDTVPSRQFPVLVLS